MKDPAFLFYSKDFYEGTRTMLPEERACYIDLMIYQHQNGPIPDDIRRVKQYCSGVDEATLQSTLKAKFIQTPHGWVNERLQIIINERNNYAIKQSENGRIGQFYKKSKEVLNTREYQELRRLYDGKTNDELIKEIEKFDLNNKATLQATLKGLLKHRAFGIVIVIEDIIKEFELEDRYVEILNLWIDYKKKKRKAYKTAESTKQMVKNLIEISGGNFDAAKRIIENSIGNNWDGLFPLKNSKTNGHDFAVTDTRFVPKEYDENEKF